MIQPKTARRHMQRIWQGRVLILAALPACVWAADVRNGAKVLEDQDCLQCHTVRQQGLGHEPARIGPDLGERLAPTYSPSILASLLWNHTPAMWKSMADRRVTVPSATETDWQDVFVYLYSLQFFEPPAEVNRGKQVLQSKRCTACHSLPNASPSGRGPSIEEWAPADDAVAIAAHLWNHAASMKREFAKSKIPWKALTARDLMDITAYVQSVRSEAPRQDFLLTQADEGKTLFDNRCAICHREPMKTFAVDLRNKTVLDIGASLWNHMQYMPLIPLPPDDMRKVLAYAWQLQYDGPGGSIALGQRAFVQKRCAECHRDPLTGMPRSPRPEKTFTAFSMVALSWGPGREMHRQMQDANIPWPTLTPAEVLNLAAYMNSLGPERRK